MVYIFAGFPNEFVQQKTEEGHLCAAYRWKDNLRIFIVFMTDPVSTRATFTWAGSEFF